MKNVYITGASGVLGASLAEHFSKLSDISLSAVARRPCPTLPASDPAQRRVDSLHDARWLARAHHRATVIHCAGLSQPRQPFRNFDVLAREHILPHVEMLEAMLARGWRGRLIFLSSGGAVYGEPLQQPIPETHPTSPKSFYGLHKLCLEAAFTQLARERGFELVILRVSNPYGSLISKPDQGVIPILINAFLTGQVFRIIGDGSAERDYLEITDFTRAVEAALRLEMNTPDMVFNIGSGRAVSLNQLMRLLGAHLDRPLRTTRVAAAEDVHSNVLDCSRAREVLGWSARVPLEAGLVRLLEAMHVAGRQQGRA